MDEMRFSNFNLISVTCTSALCFNCHLTPPQGGLSVLQFGSVIKAFLAAKFIYSCIYFELLAPLDDVALLHGSFILSVLVDNIDKSHDFFNRSTSTCNSAHPRRPSTTCTRTQRFASAHLVPCRFCAVPCEKLFIPSLPRSASSCASLKPASAITLHVYGRSLGGACSEVEFLYQRAGGELEEPTTAC